MSTATDLLAAIQAHPDDDTPRLVCADYFEENGDPERGELIRVQCEKARLPDWDRQAKLLRHRERVLLARHGRDWLAELGQVPGVEWGRFDRGFVSEIRVKSAKDLLAAAEAARAVAPVDAVTFTTAEVTFGRKKMALPWVRTVRLTQRYEFDADRFERLLESGLCENLRVLDLRGCGVENPGAQVIARAKHLKHLEEVDLTNCFVGVAGAVALAGAKHLKTLKALRFSSYGSGYVDDPFVTTEGLRAIVANDSPLKNLVTLELGGNMVDGDGIGLLLGSPNLSKLETVSLGATEFNADDVGAAETAARWKDLDLTYSPLGAQTVRALLQLPQLSSLARLRVRACNLTAEAVGALARSPAAAELRELYAASNGFGSGGVQKLAGADWPHLHTLDLAENNLKPDAVAHLAASDGLPELVDLNLGTNTLDDHAARAIAGAKWAAGLRRLDLSANKLGHDGAAALAASPHLRGLHRLNLSGNTIGPEGVRALAAADWPDLTDLHLNGTHTADPALAALIRSNLLPRLLVLHLENCNLDPTAVRALTEGADAPYLGELWLGGNPKLGSEGIGYLLDAEVFPALRCLGVTGCGIDEAGMERLAGSALVARLTRLQAWTNKMTQDLFRQLSALAWQDFGPDWVDEDVVGRDEYD